MKQYVLGFAFSRDKKDIILISKLRPDWQKGKLNGVGGKVEFEDISPIDAMYREFKEETGVECSREPSALGDYNNSWQSFGFMKFEDDITGIPSIVYLFKMFSNVIYQCKTMEDEEIVRVSVDTALTVLPVMHNLPILIRLALSTEFKHCELSDKISVI